jgi:hypothetical protein
VLRLQIGHPLPTWVLLATLAAGWFQFIGDWINVRYLDRQIARAEREQGTG